MVRTRQYYEAQGFQTAYRYAHHEDAPFASLTKPLAECSVGLVTTASLNEREPLAPREVDSGSTTHPPTGLFTDDLSWDKQATHTNDLNSFCPISTLQELAASHYIGALAPRFHCAPTEYSHHTTNEKDAPEILRRLQEDKADIALLVPL